MTRSFEPGDPDFEARVRASFDRQKVMHLIGARMTRVEPGMVEIELPFRDDLTQQHGFIHAGIASTIADSAGGYAGLPPFPADASVLTVEYKINLMAPAEGEKLIATGRVVKHGRTLTICDLEVVAMKGGREKPCARRLQTPICLKDRPNLSVAG